MRLLRTFLVLSISSLAIQTFADSPAPTTQIFPKPISEARWHQFIAGLPADSPMRQMRREDVFESDIAIADNTTQPATKPADPTMDFLLNTAAKPATTKPVAETPATQPAALVDKGKDDDSRPAVITLSNGKTVTGNASTTTDKPVRIWDDSIKDYRDIPFSLIQSATAVVNWERDEPEWQFKESGSDVKTYTGRTYPARETSYEFVLINGEKITGDTAAPIYVEIGDTTKTFVLHKRDKGVLGQKLADLIYVKKIDFPAK